MLRQQRVNGCGSRIIERAVERVNVYLFVFVLKEDILSTCSNKNNVM